MTEKAVISSNSGAEYQPLGTIKQVGNISVYVTGTGSKFAIGVHGIFGLDMMNTPRFVDKLAEKAGLRVFMPDYFHGQPWPKDKFPPKDFTELIKWMGENGSYEKVVRPITRQIMEWAEERFGKPASEEHKWVMFGFSFGGRRTTDALSDSSMSLAAGVSYYAPFLLSADATKIRAPMCFHAGCDDAPLDPLVVAAKGRADTIGAACEFYTYEQRHGFLNHHADYADAACAKAIADVLERTVAFLSKNYNW